MNLLSTLFIAASAFFLAPTNSTPPSNLEKVTLEEVKPTMLGSIIIVDDVILLDSGNSVNFLDEAEVENSSNVLVIFKNNFTSSTGQIDASGLDPGIYEVTVTTDNGSTFSDFVFVF